MKIIIMIVFVNLMIIGCTTVHQKLDPEIYYNRDMSIKLDKLKGEGTLVLPLKDKYEIEFQSKGTLDLFTFTNCHRLHTQEEAGGFFSPRTVKYNYIPDAPLETTYACPTQIAGYEVSGENSWGFFDIETKDAILPAFIKCNGKQYKSNGVTICQSKFGLMQVIQFDTEVVFSPEAAKSEFCKTIKYTTKDNKEFIYEMPRRECSFIFIEKATPNREHRLNTIGFEKVIIRK